MQTVCSNLRFTNSLLDCPSLTDHMVPIDEQAAYWTEHYLQVTRPRLGLDTRTQALFLTGYGGPFNPDALSGMVSQWIKQTGLPKKGSWHLLHHTCATHMLDDAVAIRFIQELLGHEKLDTTAIYTEVSIKQLQEVHARCHPATRLPGDVETGKLAP